MDVRVFSLLLVATLTFFWTFESGTAGTHSIQQFVPPEAIDGANSSKMAHRCPYLDPCEIGNDYMELFEKIRKGVNCPPQPQRCSLNKSSTAVPVTQPAITTTTNSNTTITNSSMSPFNVLWCPYLQSDFGNKDFLQRYEEMLRSIGCPINSKPTIANETSISAVPAIANGTSVSAVPVITNGTPTSAKRARAHGTADIVVVKKPDLTTTIFEAMVSPFRKFHF